MEESKNHWHGATSKPESTPTPVERSSDEYILLALTFGGCLAITPFFILRFMNADWAVAVLDGLVIAALFCLGVVVLVKRITIWPGRILAALALLAAVASCYLKGASQVYWLYPAILACFYLLAPTTALLSSCFALAAATPFMYQQFSFSEFITVEITFAVSFLFAYVFADRNQQQNNYLRKLANVDPLLHIGNRRALEQKLNESVRLQSRLKQPLCLIIFDLDHFKRVNDKHGHAIGDAVLVHITQLIRGRLRETDALYRLGGEEFVVLPLYNSLAEAEHLAEELRSLVERVPFSSDISMTISLGVAQYQANESPAHWLNRADQALYQAKSAGRNQVRFSS